MMRMGKWQFRPTLWPTLVMLLLLVILVRLGIWQLQRADYKRALIAQYQQAGTLPPVSLNDAVTAGTLRSLLRYRQVLAQGHYDGARQVLLPDMAHDDQVGYEVLTPFVLLPQQMTVLVDRGWLAADPTAKRLPDVRVGGAARQVRGVLGILPVPGIRLGAAPVPTGWPKVMLYPRHQDLAPLFGGRLLQPVLLLDADGPNGFVRDWRPDVGFPPVRHLAYALQWFALALALVVIWIVVNSKRVKHSGH